MQLQVWCRVSFRVCIKFNIFLLKPPIFDEFFVINILKDRVYTKAIRQLGLVASERIVNSGFAFVDYSLIDNSTSLSNC